MAWQTPKTNWTAADGVTDADMNRIEGNIQLLRTADGILLIDTEGHFVADNVEAALHELYTNTVNGKTAIASAITSMGQAASGGDSYDTLANKIRAISTDANAAVGDVLTGKTFYQGGAKRTGTMPNRGAVIITPTTSNQAIPAGYHNGSGYVKGDANLVAANIKSGVSIFGVTGTVKEYKAASGSVSVSNTSTQTVSGLGFTPQVIIIIYTSSSITFVCSYKEGYVDLWHRNPPGATLDGKNPAFSVSSGQFSFCVPRSSWVPGTANWYAYGY